MVHYNPELIENFKSVSSVIPSRNIKIIMSQVVPPRAVCIIMFFRFLHLGKLFQVVYITNATSTSVHY